MIEKLKEVLKGLGLPVGLAGIIAAVAVFLGLDLDAAFALFSVLAGLPFIVSLVIDLLKMIGLVKKDSAPRWNAGLNLLAIVGLAFIAKYYPDLDVATLDAQLLEIAKILVVVGTWLAQLFTTRAAHLFYTRALGIKSFRVAG